MKKDSAGSASAVGIPTYIRSVDGVLTPADREYLRHKLGHKLGKFAPAVQRVSARVEDVNGTRGGIDKRCRIKVVMTGLPTVVAEDHHESLKGAMDSALARMERTVRRATERRRLKPKKGAEGIKRA